MSQHTLAVYGTLKRAYGNHRLIRDSHFLGEGFTVRNFIMKGDGFPKLYDTEQDDQERQVLVEVYSVSDEELACCDMLEGHPNWYRRRQEPIVMLDSWDDDPIMAWIYIMHDGSQRNEDGPFLKDYRGYRLQVWERPNGY